MTASEALVHEARRLEHLALHVWLSRGRQGFSGGQYSMARLAARTLRRQACYLANNEARFAEMS